MSLARFDCNDYSVPVRYAHLEVTVKGSVDRVRICRQDRILAEHARLWEKAKIAFEPLHYLELLGRKPGALDQARPLAEWHLPECFHQLRARLEAKEPGWGTREFIRMSIGSCFLARVVSIGRPGVDVWAFAGLGGGS